MHEAGAGLPLNPFVVIAGYAPARRQEGCVAVNNVLESRAHEVHLTAQIVDIGRVARGVRPAAFFPGGDHGHIVVHLFALRDIVEEGIAFPGIVVH